MVRFNTVQKAKNNGGSMTLKGIPLRMCVGILAFSSLSFAGVIPIDQFTGQFQETWESFSSGGLIANNTVIMSGEAIISNPGVGNYIYGPGGWGLGSSGSAQSSDGTKGLAVIGGSQTATITFASPVSDFGAFWGDATGSFPDPNTVSVSFFDSFGALIDTATFNYSHSG